MRLVLSFLFLLGGVVATISFWVWLGTLLLWKIFGIVGAASLIYPSFWITIIGSACWLIGLGLAASYGKTL